MAQAGWLQAGSTQVGPGQAGSTAAGSTRTRWQAGLAAALVGVALLGAAPAQAAPAAAPATPAPFHAGLVSAAAPWALLGTALVLAPAIGQSNAAIFALAAPFSVGAGQAYAGDPWRGAAVGAGGAAAFYGGVLLGGIGGWQLATNAGARANDAVLVGVLAAGVINAGYYGWAIADAARTARAAGEVPPAP